MLLYNISKQQKLVYKLTHYKRQARQLSESHKPSAILEGVRRPHFDDAGAFGIEM